MHGVQSAMAGRQGGYVGYMDTRQTQKLKKTVLNQWKDISRRFTEWSFGSCIVKHSYISAKQLSKTD